MQWSQIIAYTFVEDDRRQLSQFYQTTIYKKKINNTNDVAELRPQICYYMYAKLN